MTLEDITILHVEDNTLVKEYMDSLLESKVKKIYFAEDGKEGLELYDEVKPDIIISDIYMPNQNGLEMAEKIRDIDRKQPIVFLTGFDEIKSLKKAIELGVKFFISKPVRGEEIFKVLDSVIEEINERNRAIDKEKVDVIVELIKEIGHHWRQPLTVALTISSTFEIKKRTNKYESIDEEIYDMNVLSSEIKKLSDILGQVEKIDFNNTKLEDIEKIIKISNPYRSNR